MTLFDHNDDHDYCLSVKKPYLGIKAQGLNTDLSSVASFFSNVV